MKYLTKIKSPEHNIGWFKSIIIKLCSGCTGSIKFTQGFVNAREERVTKRKQLTKRIQRHVHSKHDIKIE